MGRQSGLFWWLVGTGVALAGLSVVVAVTGPLPGWAVGLGGSLTMIGTAVAMRRDGVI